MNSWRIFYKQKTTGNVTFSKPNSISNYIPLHVRCCESDKKRVIEFLKYLVVSIKEINFIKNDLLFLLSEIDFKKISNKKCDLLNGNVFYTFICICDKIFPYELAFSQENISKSQLDYIKKTMETTRVQIYSKKINQDFIPVPWDIKI